MPPENNPFLMERKLTPDETEEQKKEDEDNEEYVTNWMKKNKIEFGNIFYVIINEKVSSIVIEKSFLVEVRPVEEGSENLLAVYARYLKKEIGAGNIEIATPERVRECYRDKIKSINKEIEFQNMLLKDAKKTLESL